jgi:hypothetical protein
MTNRIRWIMTALAGGAAVVAVGGGAAVATGQPDAERPITGEARATAEAAALAHVGEGRVTGTEVGDEESYYEVEVTLPDGRQVDVQLDQDFRVVGTEADDGSGDDGSGDDGSGGTTEGD